MMRNALLWGLLALTSLPATSAAQGDDVPAVGEAPSGIDDPLFSSRGSWGQPGPDQWGLRSAKLVQGTGATTATPGAHPITVAVLDTGLDYLHPDIDANRLWRNQGEELNGIDDDGNGYVDDVIGWNFVEASNNPWDHAGHGTHVAGIIGAATDNGVGIAGINPEARLMPLVVLNAAGRGRSSQIAAAIYYAVDHGARVLNLSLGGSEASDIERRAVEYATRKGALVVVAAGNTSRATDGYGVADLPGVLGVAASGRDGTRARFSNWGRGVALAAPGVEILSLRARGTDFLQVSGAERYESGTAAVGADGQYLQASGTSFAAAFVSGLASLILSRDPELSPQQVQRMILQSAHDVAPAGVDQLTGHGLLDAAAALRADPDFFVDAAIERVELTQDGLREVALVIGTADASSFEGGTLQLRPLTENSTLEFVPLQIPSSVRSGVLATLDARMLQRAPEWELQLVSRHADGRERETRFVLQGGTVQSETEHREAQIDVASRPADRTLERDPSSTSSSTSEDPTQVDEEHGAEIELELTLSRVPRRVVELGRGVDPGEWISRAELSELRAAKLPDGGSLLSFQMSETEWQQRNADLCSRDGVRGCEPDRCREFLSPRDEDEREPHSLKLDFSTAAYLRGHAQSGDGGSLAGARVWLEHSAPSVARLFEVDAEDASVAGGAGSAAGATPGAVRCDPSGLEAAGVTPIASSAADGSFSLPAPQTGGELDRGCWQILVSSECELRRVPLRTAAPEFEPYRLLALVKSGDSGSVARLSAQLASLAGLRVLDTQPLEAIERTLVRFEVPRDGPLVALALEQLQGDARVDLAQRELRYRTSSRYDDPLAWLSYGPEKIGADRLHAVATGKAVRVAVIDTGVDLAHPEFSSQLLEPIDVSGFGYSADLHGTAVAGVIAAQPENGIGAFGVAPGVEILPIKACQPADPGDLQGRCWSSTIAAALDAAIRAQGQVINMSVAGPPDALVRRMIDAAHAAGSIVIASAGNGGPDALPSYPAALESVVGVTALDRRDRFYEQATRGAFVGLAAPGVEIVSPIPGGGYPALSGTSLAAAHVSGVAALLLELSRDATPAELAATLYTSALDLGETGRDPLYGYGRVDSCEAARRLSDDPDLCSALNGPRPGESAPTQESAVGTDEGGL